MKYVSIFKAVLLLSFLILSQSGLFFPLENDSVRTINMKVAIDQGFGTETTLRIKILRLVAASSKHFEKHFGITFRIVEFEKWDPDQGLKSTLDVYNDLRKKVPQGRNDIVLGLTSHFHSNCTLPGIANYLYGYILMQGFHPMDVLESVLNHELCHIFGAVDLNEKGSIMNKGKM